jgi:outer membrane protein OmpA-like peptidoglycan-associated protein/tetratricopeptide (TPR) repeat protein
MKKVTLLFTILCSTVLKAQFTEFEVKSMINQASEKELLYNSSRFLQENHYHFAELTINRLLEINPESRNYNYRKGFIVLGMRRDEKEAIKHLLKASKDAKIQMNYDMYAVNEDALPPDVFFHLGRAYHLDEQFDFAIENYNKFLNLTSNKSELISETKKRIIQCGVAKRLMLEPANVTIKNLGAAVNSIYADFSSNISLDGSSLYFTSRRPWDDKSSDNYRDPLLNHFPEDIYQSSKDGLSWKLPKRVLLCKPQYNEATVSVSIDERRIYTYNDKVGAGDIYYSDFQNGKFNEIKPVDFKNVNEKNWWDTHFTVSPDGNLIFFVSDKPGGYGKRDIYFMEKVNGEWSDPQNIGGNINTTSDEDSPFMGLDNNTLYFSSNDSTSMGEFDIFMSVRDENGIWSQPVNLGYPINSVGDDIFYSHTSDGRKAYFTSFRKGGLGERDIYEMELPATVVSDVALFNAQIIQSNGESIPEFSYLSIQCVDCASSTEEIILNPRLEDGVYLAKLEKCKNYLLKYYYDSNDKSPLKQSISTSCDLAYEEIKRQIVLDERQKKFVPIYQYRFEGLVADKSSGTPIANASISINSKDLNVESGFSLNNGVYNSSIAKGRTFGDSLNYVVKVSAEGYLSQSFELSEVLANDSVLKLSFLLDKTTPGTDLGPFSILYNFDKSDLRPDAIVILDKIVNILNQNPSVNIELGSHSDSRGIDAYNQYLSERRAKSAAQYIASKISNPERITYKGYGESKLKNRCSDGVKCTAAEHQQNRRTEFIIK